MKILPAVHVFTFLSYVIAIPFETKHNKELARRGTIECECLGSSIKSTGKDGKIILRPHLNNRARIQYLDNELEIYIKCIRSYVQDACFSNNLFQSHAKILSDKLVKLEALYKTVNPVGLQLREKLQFARDLFQKMLHSSDFLKFLSLGKSTDEGLLYKAIQFNVRLMTMNDSRGRPDSSKPWYKDTIRHFEFVLTHWKRMLKEMHNVPRSRRLFLNGQIESAEKTLEVLKSKM